MSNPASLTEIIEVIGDQATLKLVERFGGTTQRIPAPCNVTAEHELAVCIGLENLKALVGKLGGGRWLYIARCAKGLRERRNREIVLAYDRGVKVADLAREYSLSDRRIWEILGTTVLDDGQGSLF